MPRLKGENNKNKILQKNIGKEIKIEKGEGYCRVCQNVRSLEKFYGATNPLLDKSGYLSICKDCCQDLYFNYFSIYNNLEKALDLTCRDLDICFNQQALLQTQSHIEKLLSQGKKAETIFGYYKSKLSSLAGNNDNINFFRYKDSNVKTSMEDIEDEEIDDDLILFWGKGFGIDDYIFLETELSNWRQTHQCDNQAEITLLKEICIKILTIRNKRAKGDNASGELKELQDLMKTASVDPAKANAASAGKSHECWGLHVKDIEQLSPAEWYEQQEKYKDMDGFIPYIKNYIVRPIENFITGIRNFIVDDDIDADLDSVDIGSGDS